MAQYKRTFLQKLAYVFAPENARGVGFFDRLVLTMMGAENAWAARPSDAREKQMLDTVAFFSLKMGIMTPPNLIVYQSDIPNAVSIISGNIAVGSNLMEILTPDQMAAVIGHELSHHRHRARDVPVTMGVPIAYDAASIFMHTHMPPTTNKGTRIAFRTVDSIGLLAANVLIPLAWQRGCEYEADSEGARATKPRHMIGALQALEKRFDDIRKHRDPKADTRQHSKEPPWAQYLQSHPPTASRIQKLEQMESQEQQTLPSP